MCHPESKFWQIVRGLTLFSSELVDGILDPENNFYHFSILFRQCPLSVVSLTSNSRNWKIFRLPSVSGNESWQNSELFELFIVEIFLQTEKTWIFVFTAMCCASSVSSLTQGCLRLHATFQKFWRNFCYRSIFAPSVARRLVFVIGLKFRQSIYFASNRNIFLSEKFADQKSTRKSASNHVHVTKMPELSHLNLFTSNPNAQNAENSASQIKTENSENSENSSN